MKAINQPTQMNLKILIHKHGRSYGPYGRSDLDAFLETGRISQSDLAWAQGSGDWMPLGKLLGEEPESEEDPELSENSNKIFDLLRGQEPKLAFDLVKSLDDPKLYAKLLADCSIGEEGDLSLSYPISSNLEFFFLLLANCPDKEFLPASLRLNAVTKLKIDGYGALQDSDGVGSLSELTELKIENGNSIGNFDGLKGLKKLEKLSLNRCNQLESLEALRNLSNLRELDLKDCSGLVCLEGARELSGLIRLNLRGCNSLKNRDAILSLEISDTTLPERMMPEFTLTEVHEVIITKTFYLSDQDVEDSHFESLDELEEAYEEGSEEWEEFTSNYLCEPDEEDEFWRSENKGMTHREWDYRSPDL